jgi:hypothetical protein
VFTSKPSAEAGGSRGCITGMTLSAPTFKFGAQGFALRI